MSASWRPADGRCGVYRIFDADDLPIYVGCSYSPLQRIAGHERVTEHTFGRIEITFHADREAALRVEQYEIRRLLPELNHRVAKREPDRRGPNERRDLVLAALEAADAPTTTAQLSAQLGFNVATDLMRLRTAGIVDVVGMEHTGRGRPQFIVQLAQKSDEVA